MYHIKPDKRSQTSAKLIGAAMLECLEKKSLDKITIVDIQRESTVGRATFYRLFDRTEDVLYWLYERQIQEMNRNYQQIEPEKRPPFLKYILDFFYENSLLAEHLINAQKIDILLRVHQENIPLLLEILPLAAELEDGNDDFYIYTFTALLISSIMVWVKHGKKETSAELYQIMRKQMQIAAKALIDNKYLQ